MKLISDRRRPPHEFLTVAIAEDILALAVAIFLFDFVCRDRDGFVQFRFKQAKRKWRLSTDGC